jgi:hypothetical protein
MKISTRLLLGVTASFMSVMAHASIPTWTITPITPTQFVLYIGSIATVQYTITNNSHRTHTLAMTPIAGITQDTSGGNCSSPFMLSQDQSCTLSLLVNGSALSSNIVTGPEVCELNSVFQCYQPTQALSLNIVAGGIQPPATTTTLISSVTALGLSVDNPTLNPALTGNSRQIIITNTGSIAATNVNYTIAPVLPAGATVTPASCGTILPGASCTLIISPSTTASTAASVFTIQGDQTNTLTPNATIVTYGTIYQGGYVFSVDDTTSVTTSIGGTVAATIDQTNSIIWSSNVAGTYDGGFSIWGIDETSSTGTPSPNGTSANPATQFAGQNDCAGATDGSCDTNNIVVYYSTPNTNPAININFYAAGYCKNTINSLTDWYLPSICQLGYGSSSGCGTSVSPAMQNMTSSLVDNVVSGVGLAGHTYWASTEQSPLQQTMAWAQTFNQTSGTSTQAGTLKSAPEFLRCVRTLT